jgi:hypothetical protein
MKLDNSFWADDEKVNQEENEQLEKEISWLRNFGKSSRGISWLSLEGLKKGRLTMIELTMQ